MDTLPRCLSASRPLPYPLSKTLNFIPSSRLFPKNRIPIHTSNHLPFNSLQSPNRQSTNCHNDLRNHFSLQCLGFSFPLSSIASATAPLPTEEVPNKINLESIVVSIDNFFNRYPFFVATVTFIWLVVIPLTEEYLQKYKFISAFKAFKKLQDDPSCQLLDIRDSKTLVSLPTPNLKILNKTVVPVEFREGDDEGFVKSVLQNFKDPINTTLCILDNFDGNSMKVAELLVKNGFKETYAIRGGVMGKKGWQEIQETLLPQSVHIYRKKRDKKEKHLVENGGIISSNTGPTENGTGKETKNEEFISIRQSGALRPLSPYPNYPDFKPPSSPTPSKPS